MSMENRQKGDLVLPGDPLANAEEFLPGANTIEEAGTLYSLKVGRISKDQKTLVLSIQPAKRKIVPSANDTVYGQVVKGDRGRYSIKIGAFKPAGKSVVLETNIDSTLKIEMGRGEQYSPVRVGDYIRGHLFRSRYGMDVNISGRDGGVVLARCHKCRQELILSGNALKCDNCGSVETRKLAGDYGKIDI